MFEVMEHIKNDEDVLKKIHSSLEDDGIFIYSVPSRMKK